MQEKVQEKELQQQLVLLPPSLHPFSHYVEYLVIFTNIVKLCINLWPRKPRYRTYNTYVLQAENFSVRRHMLLLPLA